MAKIYRISDRVTIKVDDIEIVISPMDVDKKNEVQLMMAQGAIKKDYNLLNDAIRTSIKYSLRELNGVETASDGKKYSLTFDDKGMVTDDCINDIYSMEVQEKIVMICSQLMKSIPKKFCDDKGNPIPGVEILGVNLPTKAEENPS